MDFKVFRNKVVSKFESMVALDTLLVTSVEPDTLWETYLNSYPAGSNPVFRVRPRADCSSCRSFIKKLGGAVVIQAGELVSIWDIPDLDSPYKEVAAAMSALVKGAPVEDIYIYGEGNSVGMLQNHERDENGKVLITWDHFHVALPSTSIARSKTEANQKRGSARDAVAVFKRGLEELTLDSIDTALDLIQQNSLYRGEEHKGALNAFRQLKVRYDNLPRQEQKDLFAWREGLAIGEALAKIRNTAIGTLLIDISNDRDINEAVHAFGSMMSGYKRPQTAINAITPKMYEAAAKTVEELGLTSALHRRYAVLGDITVRNTIFVDRSTKREMGIFEQLAAESSTLSTKKFDKVEEIGLEKFLEEVVPQAKALSIMVENKHEANLVSLIAPADPTAKNMFKWGNPFSHTYNGDSADSMITQRVKAAGGATEGVFRASLAWFNYDDLDLSVTEPSGHTIYYGNRRENIPSKGFLDVDANAGGGRTRTPVENIVYPKLAAMLEGIYLVKVTNFSKRENIDVGFTLELKLGEQFFEINYPKVVASKDVLLAAKVQLKNGQFTLLESIGANDKAPPSKELWGIKTQQFHKVRIIMRSPNFWDDEEGQGNKHTFFMLEGCRNEGRARGFYNEFLIEELTPHRKAMEIVASKLKVAESPEQLSGLGFSSTKKDSFLCKVEGSFDRVVKVIVGGN